MRALNRLGKFTVDLSELEAKARRVRVQKPDRFSVRKLVQELKCSNHSSSAVYNRILRNP